jgi:hypothetical protein
MAKKKVTAEMWRLVQTELGKKGGKARAAKYSPEQLQAWAKLGGRPRKNGKKAKGRRK